MIPIHPGAWIALNVALLIAVGAFVIVGWIGVTGGWLSVDSLIPKIVLVAVALSGVIAMDVRLALEARDSPP